MVHFDRWFPVEDAAAAALDGPGLFQVRTEALHEYPRGRSAMVLYGHSRADETVREHLGGPGAPALARSVALGARWIRFASSPTPAAECERLLGRFIDRFGAAPSANGGSAMMDPAP
jgi:hypothetical protein